MKRVILVFIIALITSTGAYSQDVIMGKFTDPRDGKEYKTVTYDINVLGTTSKVTWMAENLAYKASSGCYVYDNNQKYVNVIGYLYTLEVSKNVCPEGWHLPAVSDWETLFENYGGYKESVKSINQSGGWNNKSVESSFTNKSGFSVIPGGLMKSSSFIEMGKTANFWTNDGTPSNTWTYYMNIYVFSVLCNYADCEIVALSVRCIKD